MTGITFELWMLLGAFGITAFSIFVQGLHLGAAAGNAYVVSDRSAPAPFEGPMGGRLARNVRNQIEGMALFVPLVLIASMTGISNGWTQWAALIFVCARAAYVPLYAFGIKGLRSLAWTAGFFALLAFARGIYAAT
ncbi:MAG: MAPEG family protein [Pseudomonadota bacterium]